MESTAQTSRRNFLTEALSLWFLMTFIPILYGILQYLSPPTLRERILQVLNVGKFSEIPVNTAKIVKFGKKPVVIVHIQQGQFKAFSAVCTHLGCTVEYKPERLQFHCNCHGSVFDLSGKNIAGPAPRPLPPFRIELKGEDITISEV